MRFGNSHPGREIFFWDGIFTWNLFKSFSIFDPSKVPPKTEPGDPKSGNESLNKSFNSTLRDPIGPKPDDESWSDKKWKRDDWKTEDERRNSAETEIVVAHFSNQPILVSLNCNYRGDHGNKSRNVSERFYKVQVNFF